MGDDTHQQPADGDGADPDEGRTDAAAADSPAPLPAEQPDGPVDAPAHPSADASEDDEATADTATTDAATDTPQLEAPGSSPPDSPDAPSDVPPPPTEQPTTKNGRRKPAHARTRRKKSGKPVRHRKLKWTLGICGLVLVLLAGSVAGYAWYLNHEIHRIKVKDLASAPTKGVDVGTQNILMVGSTDRCALQGQLTAFGLCSQGVNGINSDVVMILHLNPANHSVSILSIPRDLFVPNARKGQAYKIDAALYEGPTQLVDAIEQDFGIPIQHYVELNFDSFINVVNALGGIKMYFPEEVYDSYSSLNVRTTGCVTLNGFQALAVVRARHLQYKGPGVTSNDPSYWPQEAQSDLARIRRDHEFLRVLAAAVQARGLGNPLTDQQLVSAVVGQLEVDSGLSATDMINLVLTFHSVSVGSAPQLTIPVAVDSFGNYYYKGSNYGDIEFPAQPQDRQTIDQFLGLGPADNTYSGGTLPSPSTVTVSVLNGSGTYNQATDTANSLKALGFQIGTVGDTTPVGQQAETVVYYPTFQPSSLAAAQAVADSMSGAVIMAYDPSEVSPGAQVTVVTGTDFSVNAPPTTVTPGSTAVGGGPTTTTSTTLPAGASAFAPPTPPVEPLQPWDPRSCTASGGEGP